MKKPSPGSLKKVTAENLAALGAERLAEILVSVADTRADLKRRLRMELAAAQGPAALAPEIDKRLTSFETSQGKITWRQRPAFVRDLDALRGLIADRLAPLDVAGAIERLWRFMDTARQISRRYRERSGEIDAVFERAARDLGLLLAAVPAGPAVADLVDHLARNPSGWQAWLPALLAGAPAALAEEALRSISDRSDATPGWMTLIRQLADAAGHVDAYRATYTDAAVRTPAVAAEVARRYLAADRTIEAGDVLRGAAPSGQAVRGKPPEPDFGWETVWIDYLDRAGDPEAAQAVRWASFERTLSTERARAFIGRLGDFDDVEAEARAFDIAARHGDFAAGLRFLVEWPALSSASRMIEARSADIHVAPETAELWAGKLRRRYPKAAHLLLRKAAADAFRRRDFKTCDRLTAEADTIPV